MATLFYLIIWVIFDTEKSTIEKVNVARQRMIGFEFPLGESYVRRFFIGRRKSSHPDVVIVGKHFGLIDAGEENKKALSGCSQLRRLLIAL